MATRSPRPMPCARKARATSRERACRSRKVRRSPDENTKASVAPRAAAASSSAAAMVLPASSASQSAISASRRGRSPLAAFQSGPVLVLQEVADALVAPGILLRQRHHALQCAGVAHGGVPVHNLRVLVGLLGCAQRVRVLG